MDVRGRRVGAAAADERVAGRWRRFLGRGAGCGQRHSCALGCGCGRGGCGGDGLRAHEAVDVEAVLPVALLDADVDVGDRIPKQRHGA